MAGRKKHTDTVIAAKLAQADALATEGKIQSEIARTLDVSVMTLHRWRKRLFVAVARNAASPVDFRLRHERPITMGWQVPL